MLHLVTDGMIKIYYFLYRYNSKTTRSSLYGLFYINTGLISIRKEGEFSMIDVTEDAAEKFNEVKEKSDNPENAMLRVSFGGYG